MQLTIFKVLPNTTLAYYTTTATATAISRPTTAIFTCTYNKIDFNN